MADGEDAAFSHPLLLKNRYIRSFLSNFSEQDWDVLVKVGGHP